MVRKYLRNERTINGQCPGCGRRYQRSWCKKCRKRNRLNQTALRLRRRAEGLCRCGREPKPGCLCCVLCISRSIKINQEGGYERRRQKRRRENGKA